jgi:hypothetical protein
MNEDEYIEFKEESYEIDGEISEIVINDADVSSKELDVDDIDGVYVSVGNSKGDEIIKLLSMKAMMH